MSGKRMDAVEGEEAAAAAAAAALAG